MLAYRKENFVRNGNFTVTNENSVPKYFFFTLGVPLLNYGLLFGIEFIIKLCTFLPGAAFYRDCGDVKYGDGTFREPLSVQALLVT